MLTDGPYIGDPPTVLQSADVNELNRALAQRDERIAVLEAALRQIAETTFDRYAEEIAVNALADPCTGKAEGRTDTERLDRIEAWIKNRWAFIEIDTDRAAFTICGSMHKEPCHAGEVKEETLRAAIDAFIDAAMEAERGA